MEENFFHYLTDFHCFPLYRHTLMALRDIYTLPPPKVKEHRHIISMGKSIPFGITENVHIYKRNQLISTNFINRDKYFEQ